MRVVLQRVSEASVDVVNELGTLDPTFEPQQIGPGFMILVGVTDEDGDKQIAWLAHKILNLRVFEDAQGKMNRSIQDIGGRDSLHLAVHAVRRRAQGQSPELHQGRQARACRFHVDQVRRGVALRGSAGEGRSFRCAYAGRTGQ